MVNTVYAEYDIDKIAVDLVMHFMGRGHRGKAMVVAIDILTICKNSIRR